MNYTYIPFELVEIEEGQLFPDETKASFRCHDEYYLSGPKNAMCLYATWTPKVPTCLRGTMRLLFLFELILLKEI